MSRFIVVVLDGFGIGEMADVSAVRPQDLGANTYAHISLKSPNLNLPTLEKLGLANAAGIEFAGIKYSKEAVFGSAELMHFGADTFFGHQEIMGTLPKKPYVEPIKARLDKMNELLLENGYQTRFYQGENERFLIVNEAVTIADNMESDPGNAHNVSAALDLISFDEVRKIGEIVRSVAVVPRVITFGGRGIGLENLLSAVVERDEYIGVGAPESGIYNDDYHCVHMGYGVDPSTQVSTILGKAGKTVMLFGKVADVVINDYGQSFPGVDTAEVMDEATAKIRENEDGFFCINIQETDLSGHSQDVERYAKILEIADKKLSIMMEAISAGDILIVMADHGNDPTIGHSRHTRERVPLLIYTAEHSGLIDIGLRGSLSDVGASVAEYFGVNPPENGESFLANIR